MLNTIFCGIIIYMTLITKDYYKTAKGITTESFDNQIEAIIDMVSSAIIDYTSNPFCENSYTERANGIVDFRGFYLINMKHRPVISVSSLQIKFYGTDTVFNLAPEKLDLFPEYGYAYYADVFPPGIDIIREEYRNNFYYDITYTAGSDVIPSAVMMATVMAVSDTFNYWYGDQIDSNNKPLGDTKSASVGEQSITFETRSDKLAKFSSNDGNIVLSPLVKSLLSQYVITGQGIC